MSKIKNVRTFSPPTVQMGGKLRTIKFDMNSFALLEDRFGTIQKAMEGFQKRKIKDIRVVLWTALVHEEVKEWDETTGEPLSYNMTSYDVGSWISPAMMNDVIIKLSEAMAGDMPDFDDMVKAAEAELAKEQAKAGSGDIAQVVLTDEEQAAAEAEALEVKND